MYTDRVFQIGASGLPEITVCEDNDSCWSERENTSDRKNALGEEKLLLVKYRVNLKKVIIKTTLLLSAFRILNYFLNLGVHCKIPANFSDEQKTCPHGQTDEKSTPIFYDLTEMFLQKGMTNNHFRNLKFCIRRPYNLLDDVYKIWAS